MRVPAPEEQLLRAIGKKGQNVKLASKLVGWHIEVRAEGQVEDALKRAEGLFAKKPEPSEAQAAEGAEGGAAESGPSEAPAAEGTAVEEKGVESSGSSPGEVQDAVAKEGDPPAEG